jgi:hypothetical protein
MSIKAASPHGQAQLVSMVAPCSTAILALDRIEEGKHCLKFLGVTNLDGT